MTDISKVREDDVLRLVCYTKYFIFYKKKSFVLTTYINSLCGSF